MGSRQWDWDQRDVFKQSLALVGSQLIFGTCAAREKEAIKTWEWTVKSNERGRHEFIGGSGKGSTTEFFFLREIPH